MTNNTKFVPASPEPDLTTLVASLIRDALKIAALLGFSWAYVNDSTIGMIASVIVEFGGIVWSIMEKYAAKKNEYQAVIQSARAGTPMKLDKPRII